MPWNWSPCWKPWAVRRLSARDFTFHNAAVVSRQWELALESTLPVMDLPMDINVRDLNALRRSYLVSLRYLQGIIEALRRCGALFAEHEKEQTNG